MKLTFLMPLLVFLAVLIYCKNCFAQEVDHRYVQLLDSAYESITVDPNQSIDIALRLKPELVRKKKVSELASCYRILGGAYQYLGDIDRSTYFYKLALSHAIDNYSYRDQVLAYQGLAIVLIADRRCHQADSILEMSLRIAERNEFNDLLISLRQLKASNEHVRGRLSIAATNYLEAMELAEEFDDDAISLIRCNLIGVYIESNLLDLAMDELQQLRRDIRKTNDVSLKVPYYLSLGQIFHKRSSFERSIENYKNAISASRTCNNAFGLSTAYTRIAIVYKESGDIQNALFYQGNALELARSIKSQELLAYCFWLQSEIAFDEERIESADQLLDSALRYVASLENLELRKRILNVKYKLEEKNGRIEASFLWYKQFNKVKDSLILMENMSKVEGIVLKNNLARLEKDQERKSQELLHERKAKEQSQTQLLLVWIIGILVILLLLVAFRLRASRLKKEKELAEKNEFIGRIENSNYQLRIEQEEVRQQKLNEEISYKNNKIKKLTESMIRKDSVLDELMGETMFQKEKELFKKMQSVLSSDQERVLLQKEMDEVDSVFRLKMKEQFPDLSQNDLKLIPMLKVGLSSKEIATILSISPSSVDVARSRLRKKLNLLDSKQNITEFLNDIKF